MQKTAPVTMKALKAWAKAFNADHTFTKVLAPKPDRGDTILCRLEVKFLHRDDKRMTLMVHGMNIWSDTDLKRVADEINEAWRAVCSLMEQRPDVRYLTKDQALNRSRKEA